MLPSEPPFLNCYEYLHTFTCTESTAIQNKQGSLWRQTCWVWLTDNPHNGWFKLYIHQQFFRGGGGPAKDALHRFSRFLFLINPGAASVKVREFTKPIQPAENLCYGLWLLAGKLESLSSSGIGRKTGLSKHIHSSLKQFNFKACLHAFLLPVTIATLPFSLIGPEPHPLSAD